VRTRDTTFLAGTHFSHYIIGVNRLTKQEQLVLCIVLGLLLTGWMVKAYRTAHPAGTKHSEGLPSTAVTQVTTP
jgi:hypothetical protein